MLASFYFRIRLFNNYRNSDYNITNTIIQADLKAVSACRIRRDVLNDISIFSGDLAAHLSGNCGARRIVGLILLIPKQERGIAKRSTRRVLDTLVELSLIHI